MSENLEDCIKQVEEIKDSLNEQLVEKLLYDLKEAGKIDKDLEIDDFLEDYPEYPIQEAKYFIELGIKRANKRKELGMNRIYCHSSQNRKDKDILDEVYFSTIDAIYLGGREKHINYIYIISPKGNFRDNEEAPPNAKGKWFLSHNGAKILERYSMDDIDKFLNKYRDAKFIGYEKDDRLKEKYPGIELIPGFLDYRREGKLFFELLESCER